MGALSMLAVAIVSPVASETRADPVLRWRPYIAEASARFGVPIAWVERVMRAESAGQTMLNGRPITSRAGAMGLMQLMPATWQQIRVALRLGVNPYDPHDNILAGTAFLRLLYDRFGYPGVFAAYNAGPARYAASLASGRALPAETRAYLVTVGGRSALPDPVRSAGGSPIFVVLRLTPSVGTPTARAMFVPLQTVSASPVQPR